MTVILGFAFAVLLFKLQFLLFFDFSLNFSVEIVCAIGAHLVPDKHGLYDVVQILLGGLTVLLVKCEEDEMCIRDRITSSVRIYCFSNSIWSVPCTSSLSLIHI